MGRKTKFTPRKKELFITLIANGNTIANVCEALGIDTSTYRKARASDPEFAALVDEAKKIRVHLVEDALYQSALAGNVLAQKFYLVNRSGGEWKEMTYVNQETKSEVAVKYDEELAKRIISDKENRELLSALFERIVLGKSDAIRTDEAGHGEEVPS
ncbi:transposase [Pseudothermotoga sp.]|uniref:transposase n=1 Tax=Pseudothermotoga sp. TaxID=2033661 RepID=UPI00257E69E8|nr:transposase [Pseudothermotoga sp.]